MAFAFDVSQVPFSFAFATRKDDDYFVGTDFAVDVVFMVDVLVQLCTAYKRKGDEL